VTSDELIGRVSAALAERDQLFAYVAKLEAFGGRLANCAYNIKQQTKMSEHERNCLIDNYGEQYMGCSRCFIALPPETP
jgi:hypothetical protein